MPLLPKQLPPYYTPGTLNPGGGGTFSRVYANVTTIPTVGTTETTFYTYTIPANSLTQTGDGYELQFVAIYTENTEDHIFRFKVGGVTQQAYTLNDTGWAKISVQIIRNSPTSIYVIPQLQGGIEVGEPVVQQVTVDFTTTIALTFTGQCTGIATINAYTLTVDKQLM